MMKVIGLTGGIGCGKSLVANILESKYGAYLLNTDAIAKAQMEPGGASYQSVVEYFGSEILAKDGTINRVKLAQIIFEDNDKRLMINKLTHPKVLEEVIKEINIIREKGTIPYVVIETALMIEAGYDFICDEVWYVYALEEDRRTRLKKDRDYSDEKIDAIFVNQSKEEEFRAKFTKVIENVGGVAKIEHQIQQLIEKLNQDMK